MFVSNKAKVFFSVCVVIFSVGCDQLGPTGPTPIKDLPPPFQGEIAHILIPGLEDQMEWRFETDLPVGGKYNENRIVIHQWCATAKKGLVVSITVRGTLLDEQGNSLAGPRSNNTALGWYINNERGEVCHYPGSGNTQHSALINMTGAPQRVDSVRYEVWLNEPDLYRDSDPNQPWNWVPVFSLRPADYMVVKYVAWERINE